MRWFRHFSNASNSNKINQLMDEMGLEGYAMWFLLLELLYDQWDGSSETVSIHKKTISSKIRVTFDRKLTNFCQKVDRLSLTSCEKSGNFWIFKTSILLELMDKHSKYNKKRVVARSVSATLEEEEEKEEEKELKKITKKAKPAKKARSGFDAAYSSYPKKGGKSQAIITWNKIVDSPEKLLQVQEAQKNYSEYVCLQKTEKQFLKLFSSFLNVHEDYLDKDWIAQELTPLKNSKKDLQSDHQNLYIKPNKKTYSSFERMKSDNNRDLARKIMEEDDES